MRKFLIDVISIFSLLAAEAWFLKGYFAGNTEFEPLITLLGLIALALAKDPLIEKTRPKSIEYDRLIFKDFLATLPPDNTTRFLKDHDFGNSFPQSEIRPLYNFVENWDKVDKEFINKKLEEKKKSFYKEARNLASEIASRTVPVRGDHISVFPDHMRNIGERPPSVIEDAKILNSLSSNFITIYENFIRDCRAVLESEF